jgi:hypothetical protein
MAIVVAGISSGGCNRQRHNARTNAAGDGYADDMARFLAGMPVRADSPFHRLESTEAWKKYAAEFGITWDEAQRERFEPVDVFQERELAPVQAGSGFVFYPFSGPDVLYATRFYPDARVYVFAGLERVGNLPGVYKSETLDRHLHAWRWALSSIFERSFFVTSEMDRQFHGGVADGLMPLILLLLARSGCTIDEVHYWRLLSSGELAPEKEPLARHQAVEIRFQKSGDPTPRKLYYFSTDLAKEFERNPAFENFLKRQGRPDTLVKSASFLLHWRMCSALRSYILEDSNSILQDDTGVPYHYLQPPAWQVLLYGRYSRPDRPFRRLYQKDLAEAFRDSARVHELGFSLGYGAGKRPSSLMFARRVPAHRS